MEIFSGSTYSYIKEGLVSNVFVVDSQDRLLCGPTSVDETEAICLSGSMARIVRSAARCLNIPTEEESLIPVPWEGTKWKAAFVCNAARGLTPISHLIYPDRRINTVQLLDSTNNEVVKALRELIGKFLYSDNREDDPLTKRFKQDYGYHPWTKFSQLEFDNN